MTPHKQLFRHDPANGVHGDCWRTAIACLLDLEPTEVPHAFDGHLDTKRGEQIIDGFLASRGLRAISVAYHGSEPLETVLHAVGTNNPGAHYMLVGRSKNDVNHVVICRGDAIVHDPAIDESGIVGPPHEGTWNVEFLGARL